MAAIQSLLLIRGFRNIAINSECWIQYKAIRPIGCIQHYLTINMNIKSRRALTLFHIHTLSRKLGIEAALWDQNPSNINACKICKEGLVAFYTLHI